MSARRSKPRYPNSRLWLIGFIATVILYAVLFVAFKSLGLIASYV